MLPSSIRNLAAAAVASTTLFATTSLASIQSGQSTFISPEKDLSFGFTIPNDTETKTSDIYFTVASVLSAQWAAVGLGSNKMEKALVLMIYASADGKSVTLSPRVSTGHVEPYYDSSIKVEKLVSEIVNGTMVYSGRCTNCRNWTGGYLDVTSQSVPGIYATGPNGDLMTNDKAASVRYHDTFGAFNIDLNQATGPAGAPELDANTAMSGVTLVGESKSGERDWKGILHGVAMVLTFVALMPLGLVLLRVVNSVRWHWMNQTVAVLGVVIGTGLGVYDSFLYQRSNKFNTAHQILGLIVFVFVVVQWTLGFLHHRAYKKTQQTTKMAPVHVWLGRSLMLLAIVTAFLGPPLALVPVYDWVLGGLVLAVALGVTFLFFSKGILSKIFGKGNDTSGAPHGYDPEPWRHVATESGNHNVPYDEGALGYHGGGGQNVGLTDMGSSSEGGYYSGRKERSLGNEQTPREYV